jgi:hypothetical protein
VVHAPVRAAAPSYSSGRQSRKEAWAARAGSRRRCRPLPIYGDLRLSGSLLASPADKLEFDKNDAVNKDAAGRIAARIAASVEMGGGGGGAVGGVPRQAVSRTVPHAVQVSVAILLDKFVTATAGVRALFLYIYIYIILVRALFICI